MKQNQKGVSMVSLVITIIVIIILAAVAFSGSQETIGRAGFSGYTTDIDSVRTAFLTEGVTNLIGSEAAKNNTVTEAQAYNYLAKGATTNRLTDDEKTHAWLSKAQANAIPATRIEKTYAKEAIGIELPKRTVNTYGATGVEIEYFVTNDGIIFTWPPYLRSDDGLFYVNDTTPVRAIDNVKGVYLISGEDEKIMYGEEFKFKVGDEEIRILGDGTEIPAITADASVDTLKEMPVIAYKDERNAEQPKGAETDVVYKDNGVTSGSEEEPSENLIEFFIEEEKYYAKKGMTWEVWINSEYNTCGAKVSGSVWMKDCKGMSGYLHSDTGIVVGNETIIENYKFFLNESPVL